MRPSCWKSRTALCAINPTGTPPCISAASVRILPPGCAAVLRVRPEWCSAAITHRGRDWVAIPLVPYLYAVERPKQIPAAVDVQKVSELRDAYRRRHLRQLARTILMAAHRTATGINWSARL